MRKRVKPKQQWLLWCLGATMLAHIFAYFGVAYWDQTQIWWFTFLAMVVAVTVPVAAPVMARPARPAPRVSKLPEIEKPAPAPAPVGIFTHAGKRLRPWGGPEL
jgi:hypothetical protein